MDERKEDNLKAWVRKELVSNIGMAERILSEHKETIPSLFSLDNNGKVVIYKSGLPAKLLVALYLIGAAYAKIAELREEDTVSNKEVIEQIKLKKGTVDPVLKQLREEGLAIQKESGLHHVNYIKLKDILEQIKTT